MTASTLLERVWEHREETLYRELFGDTGPGIYTLPIETFSKTFEKPCDPRWLTIGVFECPPVPPRTSWTYLSSGLSNPWEDDAPPEDPTEPSGLGVEYFFSTPVRAAWGIQLVQHVTAFDLLLAHDLIPNREALCIGDRVPVQIRDKDDRLSIIRKVMVVEPESVPSEHALESGELRLLQLVGITEREAEFCRAEGVDALLDRLRDAGHLDVTDPWRKCLIAQ